MAKKRSERTAVSFGLPRKRRQPNPAGVSHGLTKATAAKTEHSQYTGPTKMSESGKFGKKRKISMALFAPCTPQQPQLSLEKAKLLYSAGVRFEGVEFRLLCFEPKFQDSDKGSLRGRRAARTLQSVHTRQPSCRVPRILPLGSRV